MSLLYLPMNALPSDKVQQRNYQQLFIAIKQSGFSGIEIRRELLSTKTPSITHIRQLLQELQLHSIYSVPLPLFDTTTDIRKEITEDIQEAIFLGATKIKFPLGHFTAENTSVQHLRAISHLCEHHKLQIVIENDQTFSGGKSQILQEFFRFSQLHSLPFAFCCDLGNWNYVGEEEASAITPLLQYVSYIHLKEVKFENNHPEVVSILQNDSNKWKRLLKLFPKDLPIAFEFPIQMKELPLVVSRLTQEV